MWRPSRLAAALFRRRPAWLREAVLALPVIAALVIASCSGQGNPASTAIEVTDFELRLFQNANHSRGEVLRLSDLEGQPVVINFWFPSCPPCVAEMPDLERAFQNYRDDDIEFIGIQLVGLDSVEAGQEFVDKLGVTYAVGPDEDGDIIKDYKVAGFPTTIFLDSNHNVVRTWTGQLDEAKVEEILQQIVN